MALASLFHKHACLIKLKEENGDRDYSYLCIHMLYTNLLQTVACMCVHSVLPFLCSAFSSSSVYGHSKHGWRQAFPFNFVLLFLFLHSVPVPDRHRRACICSLGKTVLLSVPSPNV